MINILKRLNSDQILKIAIAISITLHAVFFILIFIQDDSLQQSSFGNGQVILLENIVDQPTKITKHTDDTLAASKGAKSLSKLKPNGRKLDIDSNQPSNSKAIKSPHSKDQTAESTSNKGTVIDQSGKDLTPKQQYRQKVTQHLLKRIKSSGSSGKATVHLNILKMGIATHVNIVLLEGAKSYQAWLKTQVLNANPFPVIPKNLGIASIKLAITISHTTEK